MLLKGTGYCPSSFLSRFQLNLISVTIALLARMPLSPVLVICACFLFDCVAVLTVPELTAPVEFFLLWEGVVRQLFFTTDAIANVSYARRQTSTQYPWGV